MLVNPLEQTLEQYMRDRSELGITLRDGSFIKGKVKDYDGYVILIEGSPDTVVYRHSVLKLAEAGAAMPERQTRPERQARPERPARPQAPDRQPRPARVQPPRVQQKRPEKPVHSGQNESHDGMGTMGEAMMKWLKSQKGGE